MQFKIEKGDTADDDGARFAVGKDSGSLYFLADVTNLTGMVIIARGGMKPGQMHTIEVSEILPPGTRITITT